MAQLHSSASMDRLHYIATGEHLSPIAGDACPHPLEWYVKKTRERQARQHAWRSYYDEMREKGTAVLDFLKTQELCDVVYSRAILQQGIECAPIYLYRGTEKVLELWEDGGLPPVEPTPCCSPVPKFTLRPPTWLVREGGTSGAASPTPEAQAELMEEVTGILHDSSRLRKNFRGLLAMMPTEALWAELEEWREEVERAQEHLRAVEDELARR